MVLRVYYREISKSRKILNAFGMGSGLECLENYLGDRGVNFVNTIPEISLPHASQYLLYALLTRNLSLHQQITRPENQVFCLLAEHRREEDVASWTSEDSDAQFILFGQQAPEAASNRSA